MKNRISDRLCWPTDAWEVSERATIDIAFIRALIACGVPWCDEMRRLFERAVLWKLAADEAIDHAVDRAMRELDEDGKPNQRKDGGK